MKTPYNSLGSGIKKKLPMSRCFGSSGYLALSPQWPSYLDLANTIRCRWMHHYNLRIRKWASMKMIVNHALPETDGPLKYHFVLVLILGHANVSQIKFSDPAHKTDLF